MTNLFEITKLALDVVDDRERAIILALCAISVFIFVLLLFALLRGRKLKRQVETLHSAIELLARAEERRLRREGRMGMRRSQRE